MLGSWPPAREERGEEVGDTSKMWKLSPGAYNFFSSIYLLPPLNTHPFPQHTPLLDQFLNSPKGASPASGSAEEVWAGGPGLGFHQLVSQETLTPSHRGGRGRLRGQSRCGVHQTNPLRYPGGHGWCAHYSGGSEMPWEWHPLESGGCGCSAQCPLALSGNKPQAGSRPAGWRP